MMSEKIMQQILSIRGSGKTNMFDVAEVQRLAFDCGYHELVVFLTEHREEYARFILTGEYRTGE